MKISKTFIAAAIICAAACQEKTEIQPFNAGKNLGQIVVGAPEGTISVSVDLDCRWMVSTEAEWLSTDVNGREGSSAFSFSWLSNESDMHTSSSARKASIILTRFDTYSTDTLMVIQRGIPDGTEYVSRINEKFIEYQETERSGKSILYCNLQGADYDTAAEWLSARNEDIIAVIWDRDAIAEYSGENATVHEGLMVIGDFTAAETTSEPASIIVREGKLNIQVSDFGENEENRYKQIEALLDQGYNTPHTSGLWLTGGSFYFPSSAEAGYPATPSWYPSDLSSEEFHADIYAWENNLFDCIWMTSKTFNPTFTDGEKSWKADYVYASRSAWNSLTDVRVINETIFRHKPILVKIKY